MKLYNDPVIIQNGRPAAADIRFKEEGRKKTLAYQIIDAHDNHSDKDLLHLRFDSLASHDITYVSIIQSAKASGLKEFEMPYVLTNCHNSLCAIGGTINEDDHQFALSAAKKYGGIFVPAHYAVIHSYNREMMSSCGRMILGSDSHTRYGALGTMGVGEGGGELTKQLVGRTYDLSYPEIILVYVHGKVKNGVGPHDVALSLVSSTYDNSFVKNAVLEFVGPGIKDLSMDFRNGVDVMTTETTCFSSIWETDEKTRAYYEIHKRPQDYKELKVSDGAYYDKMIDLDLSETECMIALPMHPSYALPINELKKDPYRYLTEAQKRIDKQIGEGKFDLLSKVDKKGNIYADQGVIAGCSGGTYENIALASRILKGNDDPDNFRLSVYPESVPVSFELMKKGIVNDLLEEGTIYREAFCGPCFGAGDVPANGELSIRHTTRNFPNREGSRPNDGQMAMVALMDARSIAATALNHGILTAASDLYIDCDVEPAGFKKELYEKKVYYGFGNADNSIELVYGPNIKDWPVIEEMANDLLIRIVSHIEDPVTTTDELIPSGETSSYRSNPLKLAEFTLSRRDPQYVGRAKEVAKMNAHKQDVQLVKELKEKGMLNEHFLIGSAIYARKPGDGSAREQAASCQRVLGACANFAREYATKRYRSNCINWGILPFVCDQETLLEVDSWILVKDIRRSIIEGTKIKAFLVNDELKQLDLSLGPLNDEEKKILLDGCLINYYRKEMKA